MPHEIFLRVNSRRQLFLDDSDNYTVAQDWKKGSHHMGSDAPKYEPEPPKSEPLDVTKFPLQASLTSQPNAN